MGDSQGMRLDPRSTSFNPIKIDGWNSAYLIGKEKLDILKLGAFMGSSPSSPPWISLVRPGKRGENNNDRARSSLSCCLANEDPLRLI
jgi:hypothetical protein